MYFPSSELGLFHPLSRQRVCAPPPGTKGWGAHSLRVRGWGSPNSHDWRKGLALCLLSCQAVRISVGTMLTTFCVISSKKFSILRELFKFVSFTTKNQKFFFYILGVEYVYHEPGHSWPHSRPHRYPSQRHRLHIRSRYTNTRKIHGPNHGLINFADTKSICRLSLKIELH